MTDDAGTIRLVLVDDHAIVRQGLRSILEREPGMAVVGEAANPADALAVVAEQRPDLVLLDLKLSGAADAEGLELCRDLTTRFPGVGVLVLTTLLTDRLVVDALRYGAKGYVLKDVDATELVRGIRAVRRGESAFDSHSATVVVRSLTGDADGPATHLTDRERDVVRLLAQGLSNRQIGQRLYISETTVKFHVHNIMGKLRVSRRAELVYRAGKLGLV